jgi:hypothetical protein
MTYTDYLYVELRLRKLMQINFNFTQIRSYSGMMWTKIKYIWPLLV